MKTNIVIALLGLIAGLLVASLVGGREVALAQGGSTMTNGDMIAVGLNNQNLQRDMLAVIDTKHKRVVLYDLKDSKQVSMLAARNITYDLQIENEYVYDGRHIAPADVKRQVEKTPPK